MSDTQKTFADLGLSDEIVEAVTSAGYATPTPIQEKAIPYVLMGRDVLGCAQTGTGKTASFTLPMIDILSAGRAKARMPRSLIIAPTRELAAQVSENFTKYGANTKLTMALLIGGVSFDDQESKLDRGVDVLIATPGRLLDHFERGKVLLTDVKVLVIDEADRMLDMGFIPDVERIVSLLPTIRQTLFFSATMAPEIKRIADKFLMNPKEVTVAPPTSTADTVAQHLVRCDPKDKRDVLRNIINRENVESALIFCNRKRDIGVLHRSLVRHGFDAVQLHGDMTQPARMETLKKFKNNEARLVVCSDVAARGLDIKGLSHVFNFDVPSNAEDYIHRIGRTGRAGMTGRAFTLTTSDDSKFLAAVHRLIKKDIPEIDADGNPVGASAKSAPKKADNARNKAKPEAAPEAAEDTRPTAAAEEKPEGEKRSRRSRGGRRSAGKDTAQQKDAAPQKEAAPQNEAPVAKTEREPSVTGGGVVEQFPDKRRRGGRDDSSRVVGFGDDVPAFVLRPVPKKAMGG
ncbi:DEAD/DEAH box helicase [Thalassobaculum salexigens]|uniref:DEAD/DEAH box helicase n=1 Tax=Thalassobaculum salexigens TaxID=455360 RepID=UPI00248F19F8|nr:DEAD/DEAH box helicase [Thalassobaculum salexigens]